MGQSPQRISVGQQAIVRSERFGLTGSTVTVLEFHNPERILCRIDGIPPTCRPTIRATKVYLCDADLISLAEIELNKLQSMAKAHDDRLAMMSQLGRSVTCKIHHSDRYNGDCFYSNKRFVFTTKTGGDIYRLDQLVGFESLADCKIEKESVARAVAGGVAGAAIGMVFIGGALCAIPGALIGYKHGKSKALYAMRFVNDAIVILECPQDMAVHLKAYLVNPSPDPPQEVQSYKNRSCLVPIIFFLMFVAIGSLAVYLYMLLSSPDFSRSFKLESGKPATYKANC